MKQTELNNHREIKCTSLLKVLLSACLHGGGGPQVGEVTLLGGVTRLSI